MRKSIKSKELRDDDDDDDDDDEVERTKKFKTRTGSKITTQWGGEEKKKGENRSK